MKKLKEYLQKWLDGEKVKGFNLSLSDIRECERVYSELASGLKPSFINGNVKFILDKCNIETKIKGIGWVVV